MCSARRQAILGSLSIQKSYREHVVWSAIALDLDLATSAAGRVTSLAATFVVKPGGKVASMAIGARE